MTSPDLRRLAALRAEGWQFFPVVRDDHVDQIDAVRPWPSGWSDAMRIAGPTDAAALRCDPDGGIVWTREGTLPDILDALTALPTPYARHSPHLVIATTLPHLGAAEPEFRRRRGGGVAQRR